MIDVKPFKNGCTLYLRIPRDVLKTYKITKDTIFDMSIEERDGHLMLIYIIDKELR